jgi:hypothetical protein
MIPPAARTILLAALLAALSPAGAGAEAVIRLDYPGARLILDGQGAARADTATVAVPAGEHRLTLYLPPRNGRWLSPILSRPIVLAEGEEVVIDPAGVLSIAVGTEPDGAAIRVGGTIAGVTPALVSLLRREASTVVVEKEGYRTATVPIPEAESPATVPVHLRLERIGDAGAPIGARSRHGPGWLPWATLSAFAVSTAVGFYSKGRADDLYEEYLRTASAARRDDLFDRADTWDDRARVLWIGGQVALGTSVWLLLCRLRDGESERPEPALSLSVDREGAGGPALRIAYDWTGR